MLASEDGRRQVPPHAATDRHDPDGEEQTQPHEDGPPHLRTVDDHEPGCRDHRGEEQDPGQGVRGRGAPLGHRAPDPLVGRDGHDVPPHAEPERVEQGEGDRGEPDHEGPGRGRAPGVQVLRPGDREQDRGQEEAPVRVRPQDGDRQRPQDAVRMPVPAREQPLREREPEDPEQLGPDQEAARQQDPRREGEPGGRPARGADVAARRVEQPGDGRRDRRTERGEREPPADVEEPSEDDLRPPLLVQPRRTEGRAREHVAAQDGCRRPA